MGRLCGLTNEEGVQAVDGVIQHKLSWGWCRLFIGMMQMPFAAAGLTALLTVGIYSVTLVFLIAATAATIISRYSIMAAPTQRLKRVRNPV
jgi:hypothetical protein